MTTESARAIEKPLGLSQPAEAVVYSRRSHVSGAESYSGWGSYRLIQLCSAPQSRYLWAGSRVTAPHRQIRDIHSPSIPFCLHFFSYYRRLAHMPSFHCTYIHPLVLSKDSWDWGHGGKDRGVRSRGRSSAVSPCSVLPYTV